MSVTSRCSVPAQTSVSVRLLNMQGTHSFMVWFRSSPERRSSWWKQNRRSEQPVRTDSKSGLVLASLKKQTNKKTLKEYGINLDPTIFSTIFISPADVSITIISWKWTYINFFMFRKLSILELGQNAANVLLILNESLRTRRQKQFIITMTPSGGLSQWCFYVRREH